MTGLEPPSPSAAPPHRLVAATLLAIAIASAILVTIVLPAEYGLDPTGIGRGLGLYRPAADAGGTITLPGSSTTGSGSLLKSPTPFRTDEMTLTLRSGEGAEIKAAMSQGDRFVFSWTATGGAGVDVDMHGEATGGAEGQSTSYWKDEWQSSGHGAFEAAFPGNHGWFWQNLNDDPVTVTVKVSGFYEKLFRP
jgi:hypothetical protein